MSARSWTVVLIVRTPVAKSISIRFPAEPEDREVFRLMHEEGAVSAQVIPPTERVLA
jgi:hypothetical protein